MPCGGGNMDAEVFGTLVRPSQTGSPTSSFPSARIPKTTKFYCPYLSRTLASPSRHHWCRPCYLSGRRNFNGWRWRYLCRHRQCTRLQWLQDVSASTLWFPIRSTKDLKALNITRKHIWDTLCYIAFYEYKNVIYPLRKRCCPVICSQKLRLELIRVQCINLLAQMNATTKMYSTKARTPRINKCLRHSHTFHFFIILNNDCFLLRRARSYLFSHVLGVKV